MDGWELEWMSDWHNVAFSLSKKNSRGVDISEEVLVSSKVKMMDSVVFKNFYILQFDGSAMSDNEPI